MRDEHLYAIDVPMLFVEGTRDPFCPLGTLEKVRARIKSSDLVVVDDGDHSLKVRKSSGRVTQTAWRHAAASIAEWLER
jgi:predicted alpha/beta-hydrolase family hydrolase